MRPRSLFVAGFLVLLVGGITSARAQQARIPVYVPLILSQTPPPPLVPGNTVIVKSYRTFHQSAYQYVIGEIVNTGTTPVYFAQIEAKFYNASNQLVAVENAYAYLSKMEPNQTNPFKIMLSNAPTTITRVDLTVLWDTLSYLDYQSVAILSQNVRNNNGIEVFGEVRNPHPREMRGIEMAATFYDASGNVLDVHFGFPTTTTIAPGATSAYKISTYNEIPYNSLLVQGQGYIAP